MSQTQNTDKTADRNRTANPAVKSSYEKIINSAHPNYFGGEVNVKLQSQDRLIQKTDDNPLQCPNSVSHKDSWKSVPEFDVPVVGGGFDKSINPYFWDSSRSFLILLGKVCIDAKLKECSRVQCCKTRVGMDSYAPACGWVGFREWAITAMSCQANLTPQQQETVVHAHLVNAVFACFKLVEFLPDSRYNSDNYSRAVLGPAVEVVDICNVIFWMLDIQRELDLVPTDYKGWDHQFVPKRLILPSIENSLEDLRGMEICKQRVWNLINLSERKSSELPTFINTLKRSTIQEAKHDLCSQTKCQLANIDTATTEQLCKCRQKPCKQYQCPNQKVADEILSDKRLSTEKITAWCTKDNSLLYRLFGWRRLVYPTESYMAISHVWSDGTGVGRKSNGTVNGCLFDYFARIADRLSCKGIWWDTLSIPGEPKARTEALSNMHENYKRAQVTVVHDLFLLTREYTDPESACLALVLSPWFARGWTALEFAKSDNVKVLFRGRTPTEPDIRDLDEEILAKGPRDSSRTHWLATCAITRLRQSLHNLTDILAVIRPRSTSWIRDRTIIPSLLAEVSKRDFSRTESEMTQTLIKHYFDSVPHTALLHGCPTMTEYGGFSWCPTTLDEMPIDVRRDLDYDKLDPITPTLFVDREDGSVRGKWYARPLYEVDMAIGTLKSLGKDIAAMIKIEVALHHWSHCLLLYHELNSDGPALLVMAIKESNYDTDNSEDNGDSGDDDDRSRDSDRSDHGGVYDDPLIDCQYMGAVLEFNVRERIDGTSVSRKGPEHDKIYVYPCMIRLGKVTSEEVLRRGNVNAKDILNGVIGDLE